MRIAFADFSSWDYNALSVDEKPMGGSQSAVCYLSRALAAAGHSVWLIGAGSVAGTFGGVVSIPKQLATVEYLRAMNLDAMICVLAAGRGGGFRSSLGNATRLILWTGHDIDQPDVLPLLNRGEREAYDGFAMVSDWQRERFLQAYSLDPACTAVLRYGIAPAFENLFLDDQPIVAQKSNPPTLAYTSTPFRGLELLLDCFPQIRHAVPEARLDVYSSMGVYQIAANDDQQKYGALYQRCRETPGVNYIGSLPQRELAQRLRQTRILAYPNTFAETACISVMEALASGCAVVTSDLGALPETAAGFGRLIPAGLDQATYQAAFAEAVVAVLQGNANSLETDEATLRRQVKQANTHDTWRGRAEQWLHWLRALPSERRTTDTEPTVKQFFAAAISSCRYGRFREAEPFCLRILELERAHVNALHLLGLICAQTGRLDQAIAYFEKTIAAAPQFADAHNNLGNALKLSGRIDEAISAYQRALALRPNFPEASKNLNETLQQAKR